MFPLPHRSRRTALTEGTVAGVLFGTAAIFIRLLGNSLNVYSIAFWRLIIASALLAGIILISRKSWDFDRAKKNFRRILILGIFLGVHFILFVSAVMDTTILNATVLVNTSPIFSALISVFIFHVKPSQLAVIGLVTSFVGISFIAYADASSQGAFALHLKGDVEALLAALAEGFYLNYGREIRGKMPLLPMMLPIYLVSALTIGLSSVAAWTMPTFPNDPALILYLIGLAILPTAIAHTFYFSSLSHLRSYQTATLALLEPIGATLLGMAIFSEFPSVLFVFGAFLVLGGIVSVAAKE